MPRPTAVWRIVWYGVFGFGTVEFDVSLNAWFGELCGMGYSDLDQSNSTASADSCLENCVAWGSLIWNSRIRLPLLTAVWRIVWYGVD